MHAATLSHSCFSKEPLPHGSQEAWTKLSIHMPKSVSRFIHLTFWHFGRADGPARPSTIGFQCCRVPNNLEPAETRGSILGALRLGHALGESWFGNCSCCSLEHVFSHLPQDQTEPCVPKIKHRRSRQDEISVVGYCRSVAPST